MKNEASNLNDISNGFERHYLKGILQFSNKIDIGRKWKMIAGDVNDTIYLSGDTLGVFLISNSTLSKVSREDLGFTSSFKQSIGSSFISLVDSEYIYFNTINSPKIISFCRSNGKKIVLFLPSGICTRVAESNSGQLYLRKYLPRIQDQIFYHFDCKNKTLESLKTFLPIFHDGGIATDGQLHWDNATRHFVYSSFYSNAYFCIDTSFREINEFHSIDTFRTPRIQVIRQGQYFSSAGNSAPINKYSAVSNGRLFLLSTVRADNEEMEEFKSGSTIDIYEYSIGKYVGSVKIPSIGSEAMRQFIVFRNRLYALYPSRLVQFQVNNLYP